MKVSLNTVRELIDFELPPVDELVERINMQLGGVEEVIDLAAKYSGVVVAKVVTQEKHPNADKLSFCRIDDGGVVEGVMRDADGLVEVVCGAPNVRAGIFVAWLPPGSTVPSSFGGADPFVLSARELRGIVSNGMIASARELDLGDDHDGIVEITEQDLQGQGSETEAQLRPGASFAELFGLNDTIIDIENKMFTHRPDLFGQIGVAREISAIIKGLPPENEDAADTRYENQDWYWQKPTFASAEGLELSVFNDVPEKVPRFMAVALQNVTVKQSPLWLKATLVRWGSKPISNIVDLTNYIMLLTAQPTHAYDYDKLRGHKLGARMAQKGETATLLNGKTYEFDTNDIVIADGEGAVGLAGVMGGSGSEVSSETKNIVLEVATFDMYAVRKSAMRLGLFTDALTRFSKGQSWLQNDRVIARLMELIGQNCGSAQASRVWDMPDGSGELESGSISGEIAVSVDFINDRLGSKLGETQIGGLLRRANFASYPAPDDATKLLITAPFWRTDIVDPEDIVEEVGRLYGFDKLPRELPRRSIVPTPKNAVFEMKRKNRQILSRSGANEVLTYSFVHEKILKHVGQDPEQAFRLSNALSPDLQYYRLSLVPSLLDKVHMNIKAGHDEFALFEFGKAHRKGDVAEDGLPREYNRLAFVYAAKKSDKAAYFTARRYVTELAPDVSFVPLDGFDYGEHKIFEQLSAPFDVKRAAVLMDGDKIVGVVGEFKASVRKAFKLPEASAGFEMFQSYLLHVQSKPYTPLPRFPSITQDISLKVAATLPHQQLFSAARDAFRAIQPEETSARLETISIYQPGAADTKTITLRLQIASYERTLTDKEVAAMTDEIASAVGAPLGATRA